MLELLVDVCLAGRPEVCATRLVPTEAACDVDAAEGWIAARPELVLRGARCAAESAVAPLDVVEVAPGVFVHAGQVALASVENRGDIANLGFVVGDAGVAVIDAGGSREVGEALYAAIRAETSLPIDWLVLTHMHPDHVFGASVFAEAGARIVGNARLPAALANRAETYRAMLERDIGPAGVIGGEIVAPDVVVEDRASLDLGGRTLEVEAHETAHTDNDLSVFDAESGTLFVGDLVFERHVPTVDGSALGWVGVLDALAARKDVARIVPGHGPAALPWPDGAAATRDYLAGLIAESRAAIARGESLGEATRHLGAALGQGWLLFDVFNTRNATATYRELEWE